MSVYAHTDKKTAWGSGIFEGIGKIGRMNLIAAPPAENVSDSSRQGSKHRVKNVKTL